MNIYAEFPWPRRGAVAPISSPRAGCRKISISTVSSSSRRAIPRMAISPSMPPWSMRRRPRQLRPIRAQLGDGDSPLALAEDDDVDQAEVAGPGFLNIRLKPAVFGGILRAVLREGATFRRAALAGAAAKRSMSNMSRPIRPGRCMSAMAAARCSATRWPICSISPVHEVTREYYINDAGAQVDVLARSAYLRYREALGEAIGTIPEGLYPGDYLKPVGAALAQEYGDTTARTSRKREWLDVVRGAAIGGMMEMIRDDLAALDIAHDVFFSERTIDRVRRAIEVARSDRAIARRGLDL